MVDLKAISLISKLPFLFHIAILRVIHLDQAAHTICRSLPSIPTWPSLARLILNSRYLLASSTWLHTIHLGPHFHRLRTKQGYNINPRSVSISPITFSQRRICLCEKHIARQKSKTKNLKMREQCCQKQLFPRQKVFQMQKNLIV